jgi:UDP-2,3-diacylglucosamine pyrophosphatase LpxH
MIASKVAPYMRHRPKPRNVPDYLIYEIMDGKPIYYRGFRDVLAGKKQAEEIMGSSLLQSYIVTYLTSKIINFLDEDLFTVLAHEAGIHLDKSNNLAGDILIFNNEILTPDKIDIYYSDVPAKIVIEVDITADTHEFGTIDSYMYKKTKKLHDFGVERVIWINTADRMILIADKTKDSWIVQDWNKDIEILEGLTINIPAFLSKKKIVVK